MKNKSPMTVLRLVWGALLVAQPINVVQAFMRLPAKGLSELSDLSGLADFSDHIKVILVVQALLIVVVAVVLPRFLLAAARKAALKPSETGAAAGPLELSEMARRYYVPLILRLAMFQAVSMLGLALTILRKEPIQILPFVLIGTVGILLSFPSEVRVRAAFSDAVRPE